MVAKKAYRGIGKQNLHLYTKSYEFIRNHRHCDDAGRLLSALSVALGTYSGRETYNNYNECLADIVQVVAGYYHITTFLDISYNIISQIRQ